MLVLDAAKRLAQVTHVRSRENPKGNNAYVGTTSDLSVTQGRNAMFQWTRYPSGSRENTKTRQHDLLHHAELSLTQLRYVRRIVVQELTLFYCVGLIQYCEGVIPSL